MSLIAPAAERLGPPQGDFTEYLTKLELAAIEHSLDNLMTFPFVRRAVESGQMQLHGAYFGVAEGTLFVLDKATKEFRSARGTA